MKPFSVSCTTCRARLKVLDPSAIGQILACPKCNSMVQIVPPPDWTPGDDGELAIAGDSLAGSRIETRSAQAASPPAAAEAATVVAPSTLPHSSGAQLEASSSAILAGSAIATRRAAKTAATPPPLPQQMIQKATQKFPVVAQSTTVQPAAKQAASALVRAAPISLSGPSDAAATSSRWFWPTFGAATFLALTAAGIVIYMDRHNHVAGAVSADAAPVAQSPSKPITADQAHDPTPPPVVKSTIVNDAPATPPLAVSRVLLPKPNLAPPAVAPIAPNSPAQVQPPPAARPAPEDIFASLDHAAKPAEPAAKSDTEPAPAAAVAAPPVAVPQPLARPSLQRVPSRNVDVDARLADHLAAIEFQQSPLWQFLGDLSQMSTVPISLDVDALSEMNLSVDVPVSVQMKNTTLAGVLDESLTIRGLGWRIVGHQIQVGRPQSQELRRVRYSVADLAGATPESRRQFAAMVHSLVEPNGWSEANGSATSEWSEGALIVTADASAHDQLLVLCEKLRLARGLALKSRIDPARFHLDSRTAHAKSALDTPVTVNFARPEALEKILGYLRSTTRLNLLVDNAALAEDGMSAESEGALISQGLPLGQALASLLEPMELTYRVIDDRTIEITTPKAATARHADVEFYPAGDLLAVGSDGQELVARITRELNAAGQAGPGVSPATIQFDAPSKYLIVRAAQSSQHRVESLLGAWRVAKQ